VEIVVDPVPDYVDDLSKTMVWEPLHLQILGQYLAGSVFGPDEVVPMRLKRDNKRFRRTEVRSRRVPMCACAPATGKRR
jgi:hypothetical protein